MKGQFTGVGAGFRKDQPRTGKGFTAEHLKPIPRLSRLTQKALAAASERLSQDTVPLAELCHTMVPAQKLATAGVMG